MTNAIHAAEIYVRSIRTGEHSPAIALAAVLAQDVALETNGPMAGSQKETVSGYANVLKRASGKWAVTEALYNARWTEPRMEGAAVKVAATFEFIGGVSPAALSLTFSVNGEGKITRIEQVYTPKQAQATDRIPASAKVLINNARTNNTPFCVAHADENGVPVLTFRGSVQVLNDQSLCAWIRQASGGLMKAIQKNPAISLAYRDGSKAMLLIQGRARVAENDELRNRVWELTPEVEQNHDPARKGAAMIIEVDRIQGSSTGGEPVRMARAK